MAEAPQRPAGLMLVGASGPGPPARLSIAWGLSGLLKTRGSGAGVPELRLLPGDTVRWRRPAPRRAASPSPGLQRGPEGGSHRDAGRPSRAGLQRHLLAAGPRRARAPGGRILRPRQVPTPRAVQAVRPVSGPQFIERQEGQRQNGPRLALG